MPLDAGYLEGVSTQRQPRGFPTSPRPQNASIAYRQWLAPLAAGTAVFVSAAAGPNASSFVYSRSGLGVLKTGDGSTFTGTTAFGGSAADGSMDCPRNVIVTVAHATAVVALSGVIYGIDEYRRPIQESWSVTATGTSKLFTGKKAFARVDGVSVIGAGDASADTVSVGRGSVLGLPMRSALGGTGVAVKETMDGGILATGILTAASAAATDDEQGTYLAATVPNGTHNFEVWYLVNDLQL